MTCQFRAGLFAACIAVVLVLVPSATGTTGGATPVKPKITSICPEAISVCGTAAVVLAGELAAVNGDGLGAVRSLTFIGRSRDKQDDVAVGIDERTASKLSIEIPRRARTGRLIGMDANGERLVTIRRVVVRQPVEPDAATGRKTYFFGGRDAPTLEETAVVPNSEVQVVRVRDGQTVFSRKFEEGATGPVTWDGRDQRGKPVSGTFHWRINDGQARASDTAPFVLADHAFPIRGAHDFGTFVNRFGGGRNHKGQDTLAKCGVPLVASRGGRVEYAGYHSAAGNYVVIDGEGTARDYVYMHMQSAALVKTGDSVMTGEQIGMVGTTGRSSACHLHFELWSGPGWFSGGKPLDPLASLKRWDAYHRS